MKSEAKYLLKKDKEINQYLSKSKKTLTARFLQLKSGHETIKQFLYRIKILEILEY